MKNLIVFLLISFIKFSILIYPQSNYTLNQIIFTDNYNCIIEIISDQKHNHILKFQGNIYTNITIINHNTIYKDKYNSYHICSEKNSFIVKLNCDDGEVNFLYLNEYNFNGLYCLGSKNSDYYIVNPVGTHDLYTYSLTYSLFELKKQYNNFSNILSINKIDEDYFAIIIEEENYYTIQKYSFEFSLKNSNNYQKTDLIIYDNIRLSSYLYSNYLILFSFKRKEYGFKFYIINLLNNIPGVYNSEFDINTKFLDFDFLDNTYFIYFIEENYKYKIGLNLYKERFNIYDKNFTELMFYNNYNNTLFNSNLTYVECPFFNENNNCVKTCDNKKYNILINHKCGECLGEYVKLNKYCLNYCPSDYINQDGICLDCNEKHKIEFENRCVESCDTGYGYDKNYECKNCSNLKMYLHNKKCLYKCPFGFIPLSNMSCLNCTKLNNTYILNDACVEQCPSNSILKEGVCITCQEKEYIFNNTCVGKCPNNYIIQNKNCIMCPEYISNNNCVSNCGELCIGDNKNCIFCDECQQLGKISYNGLCLNKCQDGMIKFNNTCKSCKDFNLFFFNEKCISSCPDDFIQFENMCIKCDKFIYHNQCVNECPKNTLYSDNKCVKCSNKLDIINNKCIKECPIQSLEINNVCYSNTLKIKCLNGILSDKKCICNDYYYGDYCELYSDNREIKIKIIYIKNILGNYIEIECIHKDIDNYNINWNLYNLNYNDIIYKKNNTILNIKKDNIKEKEFKIEVILNSQFKNISSSTKVLLNENNFINCEIVYENNKNFSYLGDNILIKINNIENILIRIGYRNHYGDIIFITDYANLKYFYTNKFPITTELIIESIDFFNSTLKNSFKIDIRIKDDFPYNNYEIEENIEDLNMYLDSYFNISKIYNQTEKLFQHNSLKCNSTVLNVFNYMIDDISKEKDPNRIKKLDDMFFNISQTLNLSEYNNLEFIESIYKTGNKIYSIQDINNYSFNKLSESLNNLNIRIGKSLNEGEYIGFKTENFFSVSGKFSKFEKSLTLSNDVVNFSKLIEIKNNNTLDETNYIFSVNEIDYKYFLKSLNDLDISIENISFSINDIKNKVYDTFQSDKLYSYSTISVILYDHKNNLLLTPEFFHYNVTLVIHDKEEKRKLITKTNYPENSDFHIEANSTCVSMYQNNYKPCETVYSNHKKLNKFTKIAICSCYGIGEIGNILDYTLSNISKFNQFPYWTFNKHLNPLSLSIIITCLFLFIIFSIFLNVLDYYEDIKMISIYKNFNNVKFIKNNYNTLYLMNKSDNIFKFSLYVSLYVFPLFKIFSLYSYCQPRFIRFMIEMFYILFNLTLTLLPYYKLDFKEKDSIVNNRLINNTSTDNIEFKISHYASTFIYSLFISIMTFIIMKIINKLLRLEEFIKKVWKIKKKNIEKYTEQYIVKNISFLYKSGKFKTTFIGLLFLYQFIKRKEYTNRKYSQKKNRININSNLFNENKKHEFNNKYLYISKTDNFKLSNNHIHDHINNNDYYLIKKFNKSCFYKFPQKTLIIDNNINLNYSNKKLNKNLLKKCFKENWKIARFLIILIVLFFLYALIFFCFLNLIDDIYSTYKLNILKFWLAPAIFQIFICNFIFPNYLLCLFYSIILNKYYHKENNPTVSMILKNFVPSHVKIIYEIWKKTRIYPGYYEIN